MTATHLTNALRWPLTQGFMVWCSQCSQRTEWLPSGDFGGMHGDDYGNLFDAFPEYFNENLKDQAITLPGELWTRGELVLCRHGGC